LRNDYKNVSITRMASACGGRCPLGALKRRVQAVKTTGYDEKKAHEVSRDAGTVLSPGVYDAVIDQAFEKLSRNNRETIELTLNVYDGRGGGRFIKDWLSDAAIAAVKMRHCVLRGLSPRGLSMHKRTRTVFPGNIS
jgi:hypothetical protein